MPKGHPVIKGKLQRASKKTHPGRVYPVRTDLKGRALRSLGSQWIDRIAQLNPDAVVLDGFNSCIVAIAHRFGAEPVLAYDMGLMIQVLTADGMTEEEAHEYFDFNIIGGFFGSGTPIFLTTSN